MAFTPSLTHPPIPFSMLVKQYLSYKNKNLNLEGEGGHCAYTSIPTYKLQQEKPVTYYANGTRPNDLLANLKRNLRSSYGIKFTEEDAFDFSHCDIVSRFSLHRDRVVIVAISMLGHTQDTLPLSYHCQKSRWKRVKVGQTESYPSLCEGRKLDEMYCRNCLLTQKQESGRDVGKMFVVLKAHP